MMSTPYCTPLNLALSSATNNIRPSLPVVRPDSHPTSYHDAIAQYQSINSSGRHFGQLLDLETRLISDPNERESVV